MTGNVLFIILFIRVCFAELKDPCSSRVTCSKCIQMNSCTWCSDPTWESSKSRCSHKHENCKDEFVVNPKSSSQNLVENPLVSYHDNPSEVLQMSPQEIQLEMRINTPFNVTLKYARAEYPVDLYYLMDLSNSMKDDKDTLASLGKSLQELLLKYTSDLRLGFGSFVDKTVGPYIDPIRESPCRNMPCVPPYGFRNHVKLTDDVQKFLVEIGSANVSGNVDDLEGGFDALMQAIVCHEEIGWRNLSNKVLIFSTDSGFHMAGDGKLGGIVEPNDGKCHMKNGIYTHSLLQDYPSVSHLKHIIKENHINVIFAVTEPEIEVYTYLTENIDTSKPLSLSSDSSNILEIVGEQYKEIVSSVEMKHDAPHNVEVRFYTSCSKNTAKIVKETTKCDNLTVGEEVQFQVEMKVLSCPQNSTEWNMTFRITPSGSRESSLVHLKLNCDCSCEHKEDPNYKENAAECSNNGTYMCGICSCNKMHFGQRCECMSDDLNLRSTTQSDCKLHPNAIDCSGRGVCFCGICLCDSRADENEIISGKYCECDNFSCLRHSGELCGRHGKCECGNCFCNSGWTGEDCMCTTSLVNCIQKNREEICSNHGYCICGQCQCNDGYEGNFCEEHTSMERLKYECDKLFPCVLCTVHNTGNLSSEECAQNCFGISIEPTEELEGYSGFNCVQQTPENCRVEYKYNYNGSAVIDVKALSTMDCPGVLAASYVVSLSVLGAILLIGIFTLLLWKLFVTRKDKREYAKFLMEMERAKWEEEENPLYKRAEMTYRNPVYGKVST